MVLERNFKKLEEEAASVSLQEWGTRKQLVVFFGNAGIGTRGGWGAKAVLQACRKVVERPNSGKPTDRVPGRVVTVDEFRTSRPCEEELDSSKPTRPEDWKPKPGQVQNRLLRPPPGDLGKWVDRDCNAALNLQRAGESKWRPLELCRWPDQGRLPAQGKEYPALGFKKLRDQALKAQAQQPKPSMMRSWAWCSPYPPWPLAPTPPGPYPWPLPPLAPTPPGLRQHGLRYSSHSASQVALRARIHPSSHPMCTCTQWAEQKIRLYGAQDRVLERFFGELRGGGSHYVPIAVGTRKQPVVIWSNASIGTWGGWGAMAVQQACRKVVERPNSGKPTDKLPGKVVTVDASRTSRVSSAVDSPQPCESLLNRSQPTSLEPGAWPASAGHDVVPSSGTPQAPTGPTQQPGSHTGSSLRARAQHSPASPAQQGAAEPTKGKGKGKAAKAKPAPQPGRWPDRDYNAALNMQRVGESRWRPLELCYWPDQGALPAKGKEYPGLGYKRAAEPTQPTKGKVKAAKAKPAPQPGRWLDRDCNAALNMQRIGESRWRPVELCYWPDQGALPAKGKEYPGLGYKRLQDKPPKAQQQQQQQQQQPAVAHYKWRTGSTVCTKAEQAHWHTQPTKGEGSQAHPSLGYKWLRTPKAQQQQPVAQQLSRSSQGKQRQERRDGWTTRKRQVAPPPYLQIIKVPEGTVLRVCKKTRRKLREHLRLRAEIHSQLRVIASLLVLRIFLTCLVGYPTPGFPSAPQPPAVQPPQPPDAPPLTPLPPRAPAQPAPAQPASMEFDTDSDSESDCGSEPEPQSDSESDPPQRHCSARLAALAPAAPTGPPLPLDCEDPLMLRQLKDFCKFFANPNFKTCYNQLQRRLVRKGQRRHPMLMPAFEDPSNQALLAKLQELGSINLAGDANTIDAHSMQLAVAGAQTSCGAGWCSWMSTAPPGPNRPHAAARQPHSQQPEPGPSTPPPAKRSKPAAEHTKGKGKVKAAKVKPALQPGRWLDRDCNAALNMQRIGESRWRPLELCYWPDQGALPAKGKEYPGLGYKRLRDKPPKAQEQQQQQPAALNDMLRCRLSFGCCGLSSNGGSGQHQPGGPTKGKGKVKAAKAKPAPQPGRWLDRDCNAALNMQRIGESRWRPLELCYWPDQGALPAKGKEYPGLGYKRLQDKPPKAQQQQHQPAMAQYF
ncbi:hypothetical protein QJQ45_015736 [Haematococcus lacustris]|nr:hypothetical protein QJQ45_015736 [Haematococcus lacustris]